MSPSHREDVLRHCTPDLEVPFPDEEYAERLMRVRARMAADGIDLLFVSAPEGINYLSGYQCAWYQAQSPKRWPATSGIAVAADWPGAILFDTERERVLGRYCSNSRDTRIFPPASARDGRGFIVEELRREGWIGPGTRVGLEMGSYRPNRLLSESFERLLSAAGCRVADATDILRDVRWVKSPLEMACIEEAARIADIGLAAARAAIRPEVTELEVYGEMVRAMAAAGGETPGIAQPVLSGRKVNAPHAMASRRRIRPGELVLVDCCGVFKRYHCNTARTFACGDPGRDVLDRSALCAASMEVLAGLVRPGLSAGELCAAMRAFFEDRGLWQDRGFIGGYEMGIAFPPDWVGNAVYDADAEETLERVFEPGTAVNYENQFFMPRHKGLYFAIDTICFHEEEARLMSGLDHGLDVVEHG